MPYPLSKNAEDHGRKPVGECRWVGLVPQGATGVSPWGSTPVRLGVGQLLENRVGHIRENGVGQLLEKFGLKVGNFLEN